MTCCNPLFGNGAPSNANPPANGNLPFYIDLVNNDIYYWTGVEWIRVAPDVGTIAYNPNTRQIVLGSSSATLPLATAGIAGLVRIAGGSAIDVDADGFLVINCAELVATCQFLSASSLVAGSGISVTVNPNGSVTIANTAPFNGVTIGAGLSGNGTPGNPLINTVSGGGGGGGLTSVAANSPLTGNGTTGSPLDIDVAALCSELNAISCGGAESNFGTFSNCTYDINGNATHVLGFYGPAGLSVGQRLVGNATPLGAVTVTNYTGYTRYSVSTNTSAAYEFRDLATDALYAVAEGGCAPLPASPPGP